MARSNSPSDLADSASYTSQKLSTTSTKFSKDMSSSVLQHSTKSSVAGPQSSKLQPKSAAFRSSKERHSLPNVRLAGTGTTFASNSRHSVEEPLYVFGDPDFLKNNTSSANSNDSTRRSDFKFLTAGQSARPNRPTPEWRRDDDIRPPQLKQRTMPTAGPPSRPPSILGKRDLDPLEHQPRKPTPLSRELVVDKSETERPSSTPTFFHSRTSTGTMTPSNSRTRLQNEDQAQFALARMLAERANSSPFAPVTPATGTLDSQASVPTHTRSSINTPAAALELAPHPSSAPPPGRDFQRGAIRGAKRGRGTGRGGRGGGRFSTGGSRGNVQAEEHD